MAERKIPEGTILVYPVAHPGSLCRIPQKLFDEDNDAAEEDGVSSRWIEADVDAESVAPTFDDLPAAEQKKVTARQEERQAKIDEAAEG